MSLKLLSTVVLTATVIVVLGCSKAPTQSNSDTSPPTPDPPISINTQQLYDLACKVCCNYMQYHPETAVFRPINESYIATTSDGLRMVVSSVFGIDQRGQGTISGFIVTFQMYEGSWIVHSFISWKYENQPLFKPLNQEVDNMKTFVYFIDGEEENATVIKAEDWKDFAKQFCDMEEIDIASQLHNQSPLEHLSEYNEWRFLVVDNDDIKTIHEAVIPHLS